MENLNNYFVKHAYVYNNNNNHSTTPHIVLTIRLTITFITKGSNGRMLSNVVCSNSYISYRI